MKIFLKESHFIRLGTLLEAEQKLRQDKFYEAEKFRKVFLQTLREKIDEYRGEKMVIHISGMVKKNLFSDTRRDNPLSDIQVGYTFIGRIPKTGDVIDSEAPLIKKYIDKQHLEVHLENTLMRFNRNLEFAAYTGQVFLEDRSNIGEWDLDDLIRTSIKKEYYDTFFNKSEYKNMKVELHIGNAEYTAWLDKQPDRTKESIAKAHSQAQ